MNSRIVKMTNREEIDRTLQVSEYVAGHLDENQSKDFEARLSQDKELQQALSEELQLARLLRLESKADAVSDQAFAKFQRQIKPKVSVTPSAWWAAAVASLMFVAVSLLFYPQQAPGEFETLSTGESTLIKNTEGRLFSVIFDERLSPQQQSQLQESFGFTVLSGPGAAKTYLVEFDQTPNAEQLASIRASSHFVFFEPAVSVQP